MIGDFTLVVKRLARLLDGAGIPYMVTGAHAVTVFGVPRATTDVDVAVRTSRERVREALEGNGFALDESSVEYQDLLVFEAAEAIRVDVWFTTDAAGEAEAFGRRVRVDVEGDSLWFISPEDLLLRKLWRYRKEGSATDLEDARSILAVTTTLDTPYIERLAAVQRTLPLYQELVEQADAAAQRQRSTERR